MDWFGMSVSTNATSVMSRCQPARQFRRIRRDFHVHGDQLFGRPEPLIPENILVRPIYRPPHYLGGVIFALCSKFAGHIAKFRDRPKLEPDSMFNPESVNQDTRAIVHCLLIAVNESGRCKPTTESLAGYF